MVSDYRRETSVFLYSVAIWGQCVCIIMITSLPIPSTSPSLPSLENTFSLITKQVFYSPITSYQPNLPKIEHILSEGHYILSFELTTLKFLPIIYFYKSLHIYQLFINTQLHPHLSHHIQENPSSNITHCKTHPITTPTYSFTSPIKKSNLFHIHLY